MNITNETRKEILKRIGKRMLTEQEFEKYLNDIEVDDPFAFNRQTVFHTHSHAFGGDIDEMITLLHTLKDIGCKTVEVNGNACAGYIKAYEEDTETDDEYYDRLAELVWRRIDDVEEQHEIERELIELRRKEKALEERLKRYKI